MDAFDENSDISTDSEDGYEYSTRSLAKFRNGTEEKDQAERDMNSMWYLTIESLGTALKIFAPAAILSWFYRHDTFVFRILQHCDKAIRSVLFQKSDNQDVIAWLQDIFPYDDRARSLETIWNDGSIICDLVESVIPGSNDQQNKFEKNDFNHGQRLAEQYLGVNPIFSNEDLSNTILSKHQESRLTFYLNCVRDSLNRLSPPISRTGTPVLNVQAYTLDYIARGMGLITASKNKKSSFYIYPTAQQGIEPGDISIQIKGPGGCYGSSLIPAVYGRTHIIRNVLMNFKHRHNSLPVHLPIPCGSSNIKKSDVQNENKSYFASKAFNDIEVRAIVKKDKVRVIYIPTVIGPHELTLITKGCHIIGSPYRIYVESENTKNDSQDIEDDDIPVETVEKSERKIVFKIVDFVTEKMLLTDDGRLEKISSEDVETLLHTVESMENIALKYLHCDNNQSVLPHINVTEYDDISSNESKVISKHNFNNAVKKVLLMLRICRELKDLPQNPERNMNNSIPDIINSSLMDKDPELFMNTDLSAKIKRTNYKSKLSSFNQTSEDIENHELDVQLDNENITHPRLITIAKEHTPIMDIIISSFDDDEDENVENTLIQVLPERPKTPIFKILADNDESITDIQEIFKCMNKSKNNLHKTLSLDVTNDIDGRCTPTIDFHIGEPVTPTNFMNNAGSDDMDSIILASNLEEALFKYDVKIQKKLIEYEPYQSEDSNSSMFTTPLRQTPFEQMTDTEIIKMYEEPFTAENNFEAIEERSYTVDSAYMSIDEINNTPDTNKSDSSSNDKLFSIEETESESLQFNEKFDDEAFSKMGPAERELWISMTENENIKENNFISHCKTIEQFKSDTYYPKIIQNNQCPITPIDENEIYVKKCSNKVNNFISAQVKNDISTSDFTADAKSSENTLSNEHTISSVQSNNAEFEDVNCFSSTNSLNKITNGDSPKKTISKMVSEKKEYWDEMIKSIEIEEVQQNKNIKNKKSGFDRNESLNKKRQEYTQSKEDIKNHCDSTYTSSQSLDRYKVANWKKYWNDKLEKTTSSDSNTQYIHKKITKTREFLASPDEDNINENLIYDNIEIQYTEPNNNNFEFKVNGHNHSDLKKDLSNRIDEYLDTLSNPSPNKHLDDSRFSTPDNKEYRSLDSLLKLEKNDNRILVKWNNSHSEKRMKILEDLSNQPTPLPFTNSQDSLKMKKSTESLENRQDSIEHIKMELETLPSICNVKEKIENFNENRIERARQSFIKNRSKTIDIPRVSSFKKLQKYFSINSMDKLNNTDERGVLSKLSKDINAKIENLSQIDDTKYESNDSLPTLAEKKAKIEAHLISIQTKRKNQPENNHTKTENHINSSEKSTHVTNHISENNNCDIKSELEVIAKPICALVAVFEKQSNVKAQGIVKRHKTNTKNITNQEISNKSNVQDAVSTIDSNADVLNDDEEDINSERYKERFKQAKMFFQSLNGTKKNVNMKQPNECEQLLHKEDHVDNGFVLGKLRNNVHRKINRKAYSAPVSDSETEYQRYIWNRQGKEKLLKISEKYFVEDLFKDIAGESNKFGFGTFKGIPHKNAVLATFKSMENINQFPSYEYTKTRLENFSSGSSNGDIIFPQNDAEKDQSFCNVESTKRFTKVNNKMCRTRRNSEPSITR